MFFFILKQIVHDCMEMKNNEQTLLSENEELKTQVWKRVVFEAYCVKLVTFYPRDAMLVRVIEIATCLSVCLSVRHAPVLCQNEES